MWQLVKYSGGVLDPRIPSLCSASPTENPGVSRSTMNALIPRVPAAVGVGLGEDDVDLGERGVGDEDLRPVQDVGVAVAHRRAGAGRGVGPGGGLGQRERAQPAAGGHVVHVLGLLGIVAEFVNRGRGQRGVRGHDHTGGGAGARNFLQRDHVANVVRPGAAVFLRPGHAHEVHARHFRQDLLGEAVVAVDFSGHRRQLGVGELPHRAADQFLFVCQLEVHVRAPPGICISDICNCYSLYYCVRSGCLIPRIGNANIKGQIISAGGGTVGPKVPTRPAIRPTAGTYPRRGRGCRRPDGLTVRDVRPLAEREVPAQHRDSICVECFLAASRPARPNGRPRQSTAAGTVKGKL